jgi:threonine dehydrogenase-like Zn-dependent dehydrogenase
MKALFFTGKSLQLRDVPLPEPPPGEALIRIRLAGICSTDIEIMRGYMDFTGIVGHEFVGEVVEAAEPRLRGKRVVGEINCACGTCAACASGNANHCPERTVLGILNRSGVFAEFTTLPERNLHVLDEALADDKAVFAEPLAACFRVTEQLEMTPEMKLYVLGDGRLAQLMVQALSSLGLRPIMAGKHREKMQLAESLGHEALPSTAVQPASADVVIECTGDVSGFADGLRMLKAQGTLILKSTLAKGAPLNLAPVVVNEIRIIGSRCGPFEKALSALKAGSIKTGQLIGGIFPLDEHDRAFEEAMSGKSIKTLFRIS